MAARHNPFRRLNVPSDFSRSARRFVAQPATYVIEPDQANASVVGRLGELARQNRCPSHYLRSESAELRSMAFTTLIEPTEVALLGALL